MVRDLIVERQKLMRYFEQYPGVFSDFEQKAILDYVKYGRNYEMVPDLVREIYDELGLLAPEDNSYVGFLNLLRKVFPYQDRRILEVGGGTIPRLGKRISLELKEGHITVYDPRLSIYEKDTDKMTLIRRCFHQDQNIGQTNLMIALMPCEAAESVIMSATQNQVDFMLGFCEGGPHGDEFDYFESDEEWLDSMMSLARHRVREKGMGEVVVESLKDYGDPYPVIFNKRIR